MKKILTLTLVFLAGLTGSSQAQTFLIDLYPTNPYDGNAATDFGIPGTVTFVGGANANSGGGDNADDNTFTLGTVGTLTLTGPYGTYNNGSGSTTTSAGYLTRAYTMVDSFTGETSNTFTLSLPDLPVGDVVTVSAIGSATDNTSRSLVSVDGGTGIVVDGASSTTGRGTFTTLVADGTATSYTLVQTSNFDSNYEGDLSGILVTVGEAPEPSTWALMLAGIGGLMFLVRRRARLNS